MENFKTSDNDQHRSCLRQQTCQNDGCKGDGNCSGHSNNDSLGPQSPDSDGSSFDNSSAIQLSFYLRTSSTAKTVHLLGSWDGYSGQLPLSKDKASSKAGAWKGTYKFMGTTLQAGQRYWYYYIIDGLYVSYDSTQAFIIESTKDRVLNILDVPFNSTESSSSTMHSSSSSRREAGAANTDIPKGRPLPALEIQSPKPIFPPTTIANLTSFSKTTIDDNNPYYVMDQDGNATDIETLREGSTIEL